ncbi:50S ribosomal protein L13 [Candidatus Nomurabacteria bacterium]|nr:50S ribosomal protein L13 [Candidatus Saccharibacteria bacterium]MCA9350738.1 50S ribosomal protein L13 [Candidatus Saccharibacteria bacterium]MCB9839813.1 50S ribosomal protein L13 [Candidatus Nomurabacteria bacterium]
MKTYSAKPSEVTRQWYIIDASEAPLGRLATKIATLLTGKGKPSFTHHIDCGDFVVVTNSDKLVVTGNKMTDKMYYRHSQYPGSLKEATLAEKMQKDSTDVIVLAVKGMLPKNKLMAERLNRLKVYSGEEHKHEAQKPVKVSVK